MRDRLDRLTKSGDIYGLTLGCVLSSARIDDVLDLRRLEAQDWFFREYVPSGPFPTDAKDFMGILPELLQPALGGSSPSNMRLQRIGADLRARGVAGLVYPSARADVEVRYEGDAIVDFKGWNILLFRGGAIRPKVTFGDDGGWETKFWNGVNTKVRRLPTGTISAWSVQGLEAVNMLKYDLAMTKRGIPRNTILISGTVMRAYRKRYPYGLKSSDKRGAIILDAPRRTLMRRGSLLVGIATIATLLVALIFWLFIG
jgi:hypothetical protein